MIRTVVIAIPIFALLIAAEYWWANWRGSDEFPDRRDMWNNILIGFVSVGFGSLFGIFIAVIYAFAYDLSLYKFPADAWWTWVMLFFIDDLAYYVFHRVSHESRLFWNFHVVHHSSEQFNLSVAVRQSWFGGLVHWMFYAADAARLCTVDVCH